MENSLLKNKVAFSLIWIFALSFFAIGAYHMTHEQEPSNSVVKSIPASHVEIRSVNMPDTLDKKLFLIWRDSINLRVMFTRWYLVEYKHYTKEQYFDYCKKLSHHDRKF